MDTIADIAKVLSTVQTCNLISNSVSSLVGVFLGSRFMFLASHRQPIVQGKSMSPEERRQAKAGKRLDAIKGLRERALKELDGQDS